MGEEEKKAEDKKTEGEGKGEGGEKKAEGGGGGEKKAEKKGDEGKTEGDGGGEKKEEGGGGDGEGAKDAPPPPPPEEIVMRVYMHCEGCARKVRRSLKGFEGVEDVMTDCRTHKVVVKGKVAAADPLKVVDRVQKKSGRKVELLTPIPPKPEKEEKVKVEEKPKAEEKKEEPPVLAVVLKVHMHCEACSQEIKKRILKMKGVQSAEPDLKNSQVTVTGVFDSLKLVEHVYKRTGKHAAVVKEQPMEKKPSDQPKEDGKDEKKAEGGGDGEKDKAGGDGKKKDAGGAEDGAGGAGGGDKEKKEGPDDMAAASMWAMSQAKPWEVMRNPIHSYFQAFPLGYYANPVGFTYLANPVGYQHNASPVGYDANPVVYHPYAPPYFSDENPHACSVM